MTARRRRDGVYRCCRLLLTAMVAEVYRLQRRMGGCAVKTFSSYSFASDHAAALELAQAAVSQHPQALFTNFQWFLYEGRDTVFFTAASKSAFDRDSIVNLVADMVALAPQLTHGFVGARPGEPFPKHILDAITDVEVVDRFEGYPDKWLSKSVEDRKSTRLNSSHVRIS